MKNGGDIIAIEHKQTFFESGQNRKLKVFEQGSTQELECRNEKPETDEKFIFLNDSTDSNSRAFGTKIINYNILTFSVMMILTISKTMVTELLDKNTIYLDLNGV